MARKHGLGSYTGFRWIPSKRQLCVYRAHVLMQCLGLSVEDAAHRAIYQMNDSATYRYCRMPELIPTKDFDKLVRDVLRMQKAIQRTYPERRVPS